MDGAAEPPIERVRIERRGGLAGLRPGVDCAYAALTAPQRSALHALFAASHSAAPTPPSPGADRFTYRLTLVHAGSADRSVDVSEDAMPEPLARLVRPQLP